MLLLAFAACCLTAVTAWHCTLQAAAKQSFLPAWQAGRQVVGPYICKSEFILHRLSQGPAVPSACHGQLEAGRALLPSEPPSQSQQFSQAPTRWRRSCAICTSCWAAAASPPPSAPTKPCRACQTPTGWPPGSVLATPGSVLGTLGTVLWTPGSVLGVGRLQSSNRGRISEQMGAGSPPTGRMQVWRSLMFSHWSFSMVA